MTLPSLAPERVRELLAFAHGLVSTRALPALSAGYVKLVEGFRNSPELARLAEAHGVDAVLTSDDPGIADLRKGNKEFATKAERDAEREMGQQVLVAFPDYSVLGEELGDHTPDTPNGAGIRFVFDPIDGTTSMLRTAAAQAYGIQLPDPPPAFGVTIGMLDGDQAVGGVVAELRPAKGGGLELTRLWSGGVGVPTTCNGRPVSDDVSSVPLSSATLACTVPEVMFHDEGEWRDFQALEETTARIVTGQNCIGFMELLQTPGNDVVFERDLTAPDTVALAPILIAAGIRVTDTNSEPLRFGEEALSQEYVVLAARPDLHDAALQQIRSGPTVSSSRKGWMDAATAGVDVAKTSGLSNRLQSRASQPSPATK